MSTPADLMQTVTLRNLTSVRTSGDFCWSAFTNTGSGDPGGETGTVSIVTKSAKAGLAVPSSAVTTLGMLPVNDSLPVWLRGIVMKALAKELSVPVIVLSQLNRELDNQGTATWTAGAWRVIVNGSEPPDRKSVV